MKRAVLMMVMVGCGDDGGAPPDAYIPQGPEYDLSCLNNSVSTAPTLITIDATVLDFSDPAHMLPPVPDTTMTVYTVTDDAQVGTAISGMDGKATLEITTTGTPARNYTKLTATGYVPVRMSFNVPPSKSGPGLYVMMKQARLDALATALGGTLDPSKGVLEVWANDCSKNELPGATVQLDSATDTQWAMFGGVGVWVPRATTLAHLPNVQAGSQAGTINVTPGLHTVTVTAGSLSMQSTIAVEAGTWSLLVMLPGAPL